MNQAEKRRQQLLEETRRLYSDRRTPPAIHPRHRNLYADLYDEGDISKSSFGIRAIVCLLLFSLYITMDYTGKEALNVSSSQINQAISEEYSIEDVESIINLTAF